MEKNNRILENSCSMNGVRPAMAELPYPPIQVAERNQYYASLLSIDYCGAVSELSAITQYINNENRLSCENCKCAKILLGIAMAEMMHLQKLGELICLLGGNISYSTQTPNGKQELWSPDCLNIPENIRKMICADIESEKDAIRQYKTHIHMINDPYVDAVLSRIIVDEEYHILLLESMLEELNR